MKVAIVGCGRVADQHVAELQHIADCQIVGFCDREELLASQMVERWGVGASYGNIIELIEKKKPDVVHITTPPQSHFDLGMSCLRLGCHVLMEKPFALDTEEARALIDKARDMQLKITVCHNAQFSHAAIRMRDLIRSGILGGDPIHMESIWCYPFTDPGYARTILGDSKHWIRYLPGKYLHDILPHGIARIAEYLQCDDPLISVHSFVSPLLQSLGEKEITDELRVMISDRKNMTAYYIFSSQIAPPIKQFRVFGPKGSVVLDHEHQTVVPISKNYVYYLNHFIPPLSEARSYFSSAVKNISAFIRRRHFFEYGRRHLIERFYESIQKGAPIPISQREILTTTKIMDSIFKQLKTEQH